MSSGVNFQSESHNSLHLLIFGSHSGMIPDSNNWIPRRRELGVQILVNFFICELSFSL